jgi:hypothetical protein
MLALTHNFLFTCGLERVFCYKCLTTHIVVSGNQIICLTTHIVVSGNQIICLSYSILKLAFFIARFSF